MSSRKKPASVILGPDGKPYVAPPKPQAVAPKAEPAADGGSVIPHSFYLNGSRLGSSMSFLLGNDQAKAKKRPLEQAVAEQVGALVQDFDGVGGAELPKPERDLHTYADALASAIENCQHPDAEDTIHSAREFFCPDCRRYIGYAEYRRTRRFGGLFG